MQWFKNLFKKPKIWFWECYDCSANGFGDELDVRANSTNHLLQNGHAVKGGERR